MALFKIQNNDTPEKIMPIGGQAVIEGVMMRSPERIATAVRKSSGEIELKVQEYQSLIQRHKWLNIPIIRGAVTLIEVMILGIKHLNYSADVAMKDAEEQEQNKKKDQRSKKKKEKKQAGMTTFSAFVTVTFALVIGLALFFVLPLFATTHLFNIEKEAFAFNLVAGMIRITIFLGYIYLISLLKDVKRLFRYHGAEHKTIYAFESGEKLSVDVARSYPFFFFRDQLPEYMEQRVEAISAGRTLLECLFLSFLLLTGWVVWGEFFVLSMCFQLCVDTMAIH